MLKRLLCCQPPRKGRAAKNKEIKRNTQNSANNSWILNWSDGNINNNNKNNNNRVRAVAEFYHRDIENREKEMSRDNETEGRFTLEDVMEAYLLCRKHKRKTYNALAFEADWMQNCVQLHKELSDGTYRIGRSIAFAVTRPKLREVFAADFRDRIVHHLLMKEIEPLFEATFIEDNYNCRKGKGTLYGFNRMHEKIREASENYTKDCWILKCDMQGFFMSIHKPTLWRMLERFIRENYKGDKLQQILWLTKMISLHSPEKNCTVKGDGSLLAQLPKNKSLFTCGDDYGLPIGNLTSQMFANFYLSDLDKWLSGTFAYYGRYVDDFYIIDTDKQKLLDALPAIRERAALLHVTLHPQKVYLQHYSKGVKFVGSVSKLKRRYVGSRTVGNMICTIEELNSIKDKGTHAEEFVGRLNSYFGFLRHYNSYAIRREMIGRFDTEWWNYILVCGHCAKVRIHKRIKEQRRRQFTEGLAA